MQDQEKQRIAEKVIEIAAEHAHMPVGQVTRESHLEGDLGYDSLTKVEFAMALEDDLEVSIKDDVVADFKTVGQVIDFVAMHAQQAPVQH